MLAGLPSALFKEAVVMLAITLKEEDRNNACLCSNLPKSTQSSGLDANWRMEERTIEEWLAEGRLPPLPSYGLLSPHLYVCHQISSS